MSTTATTSTAATITGARKTIESMVSNGVLAGVTHATLLLSIAELEEDALHNTLVGALVEDGDEPGFPETSTSEAIAFARRIAGAEKEAGAFGGIDEVRLMLQIARLEERVEANRLMRSLLDQWSAKG